MRFLLMAGQPVEKAHVPTLDFHIRMLRSWILNAGVPLLEIPPAPAGYSFTVCLTHDIDFVGIRKHKCDHSMWGFLYRSTVGATRNFFRRRVSVGRLLRSWRAAASLPFVHLGWVKDFWEPFEWYLQVEKNLPATYYLIPFKGRPGDKVTSPAASRRASAYDVTDIPHWTSVLKQAGCEVGVHGIDAWHSVEKGREELTRLRTVTDQSVVGIRMHWLMRDSCSASMLDEAGYGYDATDGYNETVGYRSGTTQVFRPLGAQTLLELPLHIQDGALFYPKRLDLLEPEAEKRCGEMIDNARRHGGVLTLLWHDRSHGPERFWGDFYDTLVQVLRSSNGWFGTAAQVVHWFRRRRDVRFEQIQTATGSRTCVRYDGDEIAPALRIRIHHPAFAHKAQATSQFTEMTWNGGAELEVDPLVGSVSVPVNTVPAIDPWSLT
jgi:hypothetical protein